MKFGSAENKITVEPRRSSRHLLLLLMKRRTRNHYSPDMGSPSPSLQRSIEFWHETRYPHGKLLMVGMRRGSMRNNDSKWQVDSLLSRNERNALILGVS